VEHIAARFPEFTSEYVFARCLDGPHRPTDADAVEAPSLVRRLRPLAQQAVDAQLGNQGRLLTLRQLCQSLGSSEAGELGDSTRHVAIPAGTLRVVGRMVGAERATDFVALAAEREVRARELDVLASRWLPPNDLAERG
jgi:hypothetical protein